MASLGSLQANLTLESAAFIRTLDRSAAATTNAARQIERNSTVMSKGFRGVEVAAGIAKSAILGFAGALSVGAFARAGKAALDAAGNLGELASRAGVSTKQLQGLQVAALQVGVDTEQMTTALSQFGVRVGEAAAGTGELRDTLERYGIAARDSSGEIRASVDVLGDLADAVQRAGSEQERLAIVADAFGARVGPKLLPLLAEGAAGFQNFATTAERAGLVLGDELIARADRASDAIATLQFAVSKGFQVGVVSEFTSAIGATADQLDRARAAGEAFGRIVGKAMELVANAVSTLTPFLETTRREFEALVKGLQFIFNAIGIPFAFADEAEAASKAATDLSAATKPLTVDIIKTAEATDQAAASTTEAATATAKLASEYGNLITVFKSDNEAELRLKQLQLQQDQAVAAGKSYEELARITQQTMESVGAEQQRQAERAEELMLEPFKTALQNVQNGFTSTFETILSGGVTTFSDLAEQAKSIFVRLAAELATLGLFRGLTGGAGGVGSLAAMLGVGGGAPAGGAPLQGFLPTAGGGATFPALPGAAAAGAGWAGIFAAGALGALGGSIIAPLIFGGRGQSGIGGGVGGGIGAAAGLAFGGPIGGLIGGAGGSLLGGLVGSLVGGGKEDNEGDLRFATGRGSPFDPGVFGSLTIGGENTFAGPLRDLVQKFDQGVSEFLTARQRKLAERAVQSLEQFEGRFPESDPSKGFAEILKARSEAVLRAAFPDIRVGAVLEGAQGVEEIGRRTEVALKTIQTFNALTGETATPAAQLESALQAIREQFAEIRPIARALGLDVGALNSAMREQLKTAREQFVSIQQQERLAARVQANTRQAFVDQLRAFRPLTIGQALTLQLREIDRQFFALRQTARELGVNLDLVRAAHRAAARAAREQAEAAKEAARAEREAARQRRAEDLRAQRDALADRAVQIRDTFDNLLSPLRSLQLDLRTTGASPAAAFEELQRQFFAVQGKAQSGNIGAIQQLPEIGRAFVDAAAAFGASPQRASAIETVQAALARVIDRTEDAQERALAGLGRIIQRSDQNNVAALERLGERLERQLLRVERALARIDGSGRRVA